MQVSEREQKFLVLLPAEIAVHRLNIAVHYQLNPESRILSYENKQVQLSSAEHQLLLQLIARQGKIVSRDMLFASLDNTQIYQQGRALDILVSRLRRKMLGGANQVDPIITYRGKGYMLLQQS